MSWWKVALISLVVVIIAAQLRKFVPATAIVLG